MNTPVTPKLPNRDLRAPRQKRPGANSGNAAWRASRVGAPALVFILFMLPMTNAELTSSLLVLFVGVAVAAYRADFRSVWIAFSVPWLLILGMSALDLSYLSRDISTTTMAVIVVGLLACLALCPPLRFATAPLERSPVNGRRFLACFALFMGISVLNVALAGYVPLIQGFMTGESGYYDFGVKGVYGLYNAYANAFGVMCFYFWMRDGSRRYQIGFLCVTAAFLLFVTRQNLISLVVECFIVFNLVVRRTSRLTLVTGVFGVLVVFSIVGNFRTGADISELADIRAQWKWLPDSILWLYSYSYFNLLNLDNVVTAYPAPELNGLSITQLLPSFLRVAEVDDIGLLEVGNFGVTSYASPIFRDFGFVGIAATIGAFSLWAERLLAVRLRSPFASVTSYSVIYFCFAMSFFINFWFFLPVIFQLFFFWAFGKWLFSPPRSDTSRTN